jgi:transposase
MGCVFMDQAISPSSPVDPSPFTSVVGIDIGSQTCSFSTLKPDKSQVIKPTDFANAPAGFAVLLDKLERLGVPPSQILIGLEATSRYGENLYRLLESRGYQLCLLHPRQTHQFAQQRGLRAKTDKLDAGTIARVLLSGEARRGYVPTDLIATYRELARLQTQLTEDVTRYRNEIHALLQVLFPEFSQVFADPCRPTALALLKLYPSAQAFVAAGVETLAAKLHELAPRNYGLHTAQQLVSLAQHTISSGVALPARSTSLKILCDQLEHTQANLLQLEKELETLVKTDTGAKGLQSVPEFAGKTIAVCVASGVGGCRALCLLEPGGGLCRVRYRGEAEWQVQRPGQALQARQRAHSTDLVYGCRALYPAQRLGLWRLLPSPGGSRATKACRHDGSHA